MLALASAALLLMQYNTAQNITDTPLQPGQWVLRESVERGTGAGGISASLLSNDRQYRLTVRCDYSYQSDLSIQFLPATVDMPRTANPASLTLVESGRVVPLVWEQVAAGVFARDGEDGDTSASDAAILLESYYGAIRVNARNTTGRAVTASFAAHANHDAISAVIEECVYY